MRLIKKYANRKMYDTTEKKYVSMERLADLIRDGEEVKIIDNPTGTDITVSVVSQLLSREKKENDRGTAGILMEMLRKGGDTVAGYAKKYSGIWQGFGTMPDDEIEKRVNFLVKAKDITETEGKKLKKELKGYSEFFKKWMVDKIDQRVNEILGMMNLATKDQVVSLTKKIEELTKTVNRLEKKNSKKSGTGN